MTTQVFNLPDVGEGLTEAEIVTWHVEQGQTVAINDPLVDIETAKSTVELPSPYAGVVELLAEAGQLIEVGTPIVRIVSADAARGEPRPSDPPQGGSDTGGSARPSPELDGAPAVSEEVRAHGGPVDQSAAETEPEDRPQVLVGPGPKAATARRRRLSAPEEPPARGSAPPPPRELLHQPRTAPEPEGLAGGTPRNERPQAKPPVRLLARRLGVDLYSLDVTGPITRADVERAARGPSAPSAQSWPPVVESAAPQTARTAPAERETRVPIKGVRRATAQAMVRSAFTAPHVTEWLAVDVTETMELVRELKADRAWQGVRVNPLLFVARAFLVAVRTFPEVNASWDEDTNEIVYKDYVNLGIAAATPRGLLVPNIKDADTMDLRTLSGALDQLINTARAGKTQPAEMANGTVTITNIGALGVDAGTPILNPGESAILAFGAVRQQPWVVDGQICVREVTQLAMSFDHRLVDGELGSHVLARTGEVLADPRRALLYL